MSDWHYSDPQIIAVNKEIEILAGKVLTSDDLKKYDEAIQKRRKLYNLRPGKIPENLKVKLKNKIKKKIKEIRKTVEQPKKRKAPFQISKNPEKRKAETTEDGYLEEANRRIERLNEQIHDNNAIWRDKKLRKERDVVIKEFYPDGDLPKRLKIKKSKKVQIAEEKKSNQNKPRKRGKKRKGQKADLRTETKRRTLCTFRDKKKRKPNVLSKKWNEVLGLES